MWKFIVLVTILIAKVNGSVIKEPMNKYWAERTKLLRDEENFMFGGDLQLQAKEDLANRVLMRAKETEVNEGFNRPSTFLPAKNFLTVSDKIRNSSVFKIIKDMPKGAALHAHDLSIVSFDYVYWNITYRPNLYVCDNASGAIQLRFLDKPAGNDCDWKLLSELRKGNGSANIDDKIARMLTLYTENPSQAYPDIDAVWVKFFALFDFIPSLISYRPVYEDYLYEGLLELYNDNVFYMELRTPLPTLYELNGTEYTPLEVTYIYKKVIDRFIEEHPDFIGVKLIYSSRRKISQEELEKKLSVVHQLTQALPNFVIGFDLSGQEDKGEPLYVFAEKLKAASKDLEFFFHASESKWYGTSTDENLIDAVLLNTKRIGHGYGLLKHPKLMELARERKIAVEINPVSNQVLTLVDDLRNHPGSVLFAQDFPLVVSNDNPGLWGVQGLSYDYYEAFVGVMSRKADLRALKKLALNSIDYSCMKADEKRRALQAWQAKWQEFVDKLGNDHKE